MRPLEEVGHLSKADEAVLSRWPRGFMRWEGLTVEQWSELPETKPRYELCDGCLIQKKICTSNQVWASGQFLFDCMSWEKSCGRDWQFFVMGIGVVINSCTGYIPEAIGYAPGTGIGPDESLSLGPYLVLEVPPATRTKKIRHRRIRDYASAGTNIYVVINSRDREMEVHKLKGNRYRGPEIYGEKDIWQPKDLPGLEVKLEELWLN